MLPLPVLHGCTIGELAQMINGERWMTTQTKTCPLTVIPIKGWQHGQPYVLPVKPSPNLPDAQSIRLYASLCPFEATRISVGRGTTFPFQVLGAPDKKYGDFVFTPRSLPGFDKNPMQRSCLLRRRFAERNRCKRIHAPLPPAFLSFIRRRCSFLLPSPVV